MNADVVAYARSYLGTPWVHQGRSTSGVDCLGLIALTAKAQRGYKFDITNYAAQAADETMLKLCSEHLDSVPLSDIVPGNIVVIRYSRQRHMAMVGDYPLIENGLSLIHASSTFGKVVEHRLDDVWRRICIASFSFRDLR